MKKKRLLKKEKDLLKLIASFYGCKVSFFKGSGGSYGQGLMEVGDCGIFSDTIISFCHELGHHFNFVNEKFPLYHDEELFLKKSSLFSLNTFARYALRAEIYTDKVGKQICKEWFPNVKYCNSYKDDGYSYGFLVGYYLVEFAQSRPRRKMAEKTNKSESVNDWKLLKETPQGSFPRGRKLAQSGYKRTPAFFSRKNKRNNEETKL